MANRSGWKDTEARAAKLFPGGRRRTRVGMASYALVADDVIFGPERYVATSRPPRVVKLPRTGKNGLCPPVYIEAKKRAQVKAVAFFRQSEQRYFRTGRERLVLVLHVLRERRQFVMVDDAFFKELFVAWCAERGIGGNEER